MPLFSRPPLNPPVSLQPDHIPLSPPDTRAAKLLKDKIEKVKPIKRILLLLFACLFNHNYGAPRIPKWEKIKYCNNI